ncbi:MAG: halocyanin domain-containing protein [Natronomonas sp.]|uniref:halocyanin domain-containing protein n=1 Tax=Natronomonas sp. TaxID=2184060 RepID=UPI00286FD968|nr:halocyanin domain-containing protein [Natronomonas sp.]MDR9380070.1 halocyanin domain-containing protein [Natronomonas sp.]MDR9429171.1 halocyanin domain-containing protein [Natronomonas sp.]
MQTTRRHVVRSSTVALAVAVSLAGCNGNGNGNGSDDTPTPEPSGPEARLDTYLTENDANLYDGSIEDLTGQDEVTILVGAGDDGLAYDPPAARIGVGTTVIWEWTGRGGRHNVNGDPEIDSDFEYTSGELIGDEGHTWSYTFEDGGVALYYCDAHRTVGHHGALIVE